MACPLVIPFTIIIETVDLHSLQFGQKGRKKR
uniref:Uncharacterized protein n=1 Tax=Rhizophora mucronata TaxID=61149 RepID=A0A2P2MU26_RHIMU